MRRKREKKRGYTLVEVLSAFAILSIAILPIISMYPAVFRINTRATAVGESARIAFSVIDFIKSKGYYALIGDATRSDKPLPLGTRLTRSKVAIGAGSAAELAQINSRVFVYDLRQVTGAYATRVADNAGITNDTTATGTEFAFEKDFNFGETAGDQFFVLNTRGFPVEELRIGIVMRRAKVYSSEAFRSPLIINQELADNPTQANFGARREMYGFRTTADSVGEPVDEFIIGKVIIGRGVDINAGDANNPEEEIVLKEKAYGVQFIITPFE
jgi:type II secretory pathway pseudopilin PulG